MRSLPSAAALALLLIASIPVLADEPPATAPSTTPPSYHVAVIPPGFHAVTVNNHTAFCRPADDEWVRSALLAPHTTTRPTTMPTDLTASIAQRRSEVARQMMQDLVLKDDRGINEMFDQHILPILAKLDTLKAPAYFLVASRRDLAQLMENGWTDPRYHYIRFARDVAYDPEVILSLDKRIDDLVMWVELKDGDSPAARRDQLMREIYGFDADYAQSLSDLSQSGVGNVLDQFIHEHVTDPLKLAPPVEWFGHGAAAIYAIKYKTMITGGSRALETEAVELGDWRNPLHPQPLNLVEPLDTGIMQKQYVMVYREALFHKATSVIAAWVAKGGDDVLAKSLPALRAKSPATPPDLINLIQQTTGIDLTPAMLPNYRRALPQL